MVVKGGSHYPAAVKREKSCPVTILENTYANRGEQMNDLYPLPGNSDPLPEERIGLDDINAVLTSIANGATLKDLYGIPDSMMQATYAHGFRLYQSGRYDDAKLFFEFLCAHDMYNADYLLGLAAVHQQMKEYQKAIPLYSLSFDLDGTNHRAMLYAGQCKLFLKDREAARICFAIVAHGAADESLKKQAIAYLSGMTATPAQLSTTPESDHA